MELAIPLIALGGLFIISNQKKRDSDENFTTTEKLPNTNIPDRNYPDLTPIISIDSDATSQLSTLNMYDGPSAYTDKYFNSKMNTNMVDAYGDKNIKSNSYKSMSGKTVDNSYFKHNNMVPYFGSHVRGVPVSNTNESVMDNYTGAGSQHISKSEQAPMFAPGTNLNWANGAPNSNDFYRSRVNPSMKVSNVNPFEEKRVAPGLGLGYTTEGAGGFNSGMMDRENWMEKNVDDLRVATNPKNSYLLVGHEGPAASITSNRGIMGAMEKNRQDTSYEMGSERYFTTTGLEKGRTIRPEQIDRHVNRPDTSAAYTGVAGYSNSGSMVSGEYMDSKHIDLGALPFTGAGASGKGARTESDYGIKSKVAYPNNRTLTNDTNREGYFGAVGGVIGEAIAPILDILRPSRKENTIGSLRPYQNAKSAVASSYIYNPSDVLPTTMRETTENSKFHLNINKNQRGGAYEVTDQQMTHTARQDTSDYYYAGNASAGERSRNMPSYEAERNQRNNEIKSSTIEGRMVQGNMSLMNGEINMRVKTRDNDLRNNRSSVATNMTQIPTVQNMGRLQGNNQKLYQNIQMDRTTPDITSVLKQNPYAIPYANAL